MSLKEEKVVKKLVLIYATFTLVIIARKKGIKNIKKIEISKNGTKGEYLGTNLA